VEPRGANFKFTDLQAVVGLAQLQKLPGRVDRMRAMWARYDENLRELEGLVKLRTAGEGYIPWFVDLEVLGPEPRATRDALQAFLKAHRVGSRPMYPQLSAEPAFAESACDGACANHPVAARAAAGGLFLPSASSYDDGTIDLVCELIRAFFRSVSPTRDRTRW